MKNTFLPALTILGFLAAHTAEARNLNWVGGGNDKKWSTAANWIDTTGNTNAVPRNGDAIQLNGSSTVPASGSNNDISDLETKKITLTGGWMNLSGNATIFRAGSDGFECQSFTDYNVPIRLEGTNIVFKTSSGQLHKHDNSVYSYDGNDCGLVKTGPGQLAFSPGGNSVFTGFRYIHLKEGTFTVCVNNSGSAALMPVGLHTIFSGADTLFRLGANWTCVDGVFSETPAVAEQKHGFDTQDNKALTLTMTGSPAVDRMTTTATFNGNFSFTWNPASATKEFVLSGSTSTTTGRVTVANGIFRLADGASFTKLGELALTGGTGAKFVMDRNPLAAFYAGKLTLATGNERVALAEGTTIQVGAITVNGVALEAGYYTGTGSIGQQMDWIEGRGLLMIPGEPKEPVAWTWTGNGADTRVSNPENWGAVGSVTLPPLTDGTLDVTFAKGGAIDVDTDVFFHGIGIAADADVVFSGTGNLMLGAGGFTSAGVSGRSCTFGALSLMAAQTWTTQAGETLNLSGAISSFGANTWILNTTGTVNFAATSSHSGPIVINAGRIDVSADHALGRGNLVTVDGSKAKLTFRGGTWSSLIDFKNDGASSLTFAANTTNVFLAAVQNKDGVSWGWTVEAGGVVRFKGGNHRGSTGWTTINGPGETHFDASTSYGGSAVNGTKAKIYFNAEKCDVGSNWIYVNDNQMEIHTTVPKAFSPDLLQRIWMNGPSQGVFWDLHGCDQWLREFQAVNANGLVKSEKGALLHFKTASYTKTSSTNKVTFAGGVGVSYDDSTFLRLCTPSASTGTVQVTNGRLELATTWANASAAVVQGGTLQIERADAFGPRTAFAVSSGATVALAYPGKMKVASLSVNGVRQPDGIYGADATNPSGIFTGTGRLRVGKVRLLVIVR